MKFDYKQHDVVDRECIAFIDDVGDLCIRVCDGFVYFLKDDSSFSSEDDSFENHMYDNGAIRKFYKGDKITITF